MGKQKETAGMSNVETRCMLININDSRKLKKKMLEEWLWKELQKRYDDPVSDNPLIRICVIFDNLSSEAQHELFGYAKARILGMAQDIKLRDRLWSVLEKGGTEDGSWKDVEEYAGQLAFRENAHKNRADNLNVR